MMSFQVYENRSDDRPADLISFLVRRRRLVTALLMSVVVLSLYRLLQTLPFPEYTRVREIELERTLFELFEPQPAEPKPRPESDARGGKNREETADPEQTVQDILDFETLLAFDAGSGNLQEMWKPDDSESGSAKGMERNLPEPTGPAQALPDRSMDETVSLSDFGLESGRAPGREYGESHTRGTALSGTGGSGSSDADAIRRMAPGRATSTGPERAVELRAFDESDYEGRDLKEPLIEWMREHPAEHEYTVSAFLGTGSGDLTSRVRFQTQGRRIEMFLSVDQNTRELRILIVEHTGFIKLVDEGLSRRSHKLETGLVERNAADQRIVQLFSTQTAPSPEKTRDFMSLFLSWWNEGNPDPP